MDPMKLEKSEVPPAMMVRARRAPAALRLVLLFVTEKGRPRKGLRPILQGKKSVVKCEAPRLFAA